MGSNYRSKIWVFQDATQALSDGNVLMVGTGYVTATLEITGDGDNTVIFEGKASNDDTFYPIIGANLATLDMKTETDEKDVIYQVSLEGLIAFRVRVKEYNSGGVAVKGTIVD